MSKALTEEMAPGVQPCSTVPRKVWIFRMTGGLCALQASDAKPSASKTTVMRRNFIWKNCNFVKRGKGKGWDGDDEGLQTIFVLAYILADSGLEKVLFALVPVLHSCRSLSLHSHKKIWKSYMSAEEHIPKSEVELTAFWLESFRWCRPWISLLSSSWKWYSTHQRICNSLDGM